MNQADIRVFMNSFGVSNLETFDKPESRTNYFTAGPKSSNPTMYQISTQMVTMELPLAEFNRLVNIEKHLRSTIDKHEREFELQLKYPALREAYEQYKLLLELVR